MHPRAAMKEILLERLPVEGIVETGIKEVLGNKTYVHMSDTKCYDFFTEFWHSLAL